ncbi:unnamed protein product [Sphagnum jensenii]|uniref:Uncharacterized protein n=1 Tax=Sphagnum jensenii TaxID=128206 RepID=A0ABP1ADP1_9BRYO
MEREQCCAFAVRWIIFLAFFFPTHIALKGNDTLQKAVGGKQGSSCQVQFMCSVFVALWTGGVKYRGPWPSRRAKQVFIAHLPMIAFLILKQMAAFAVTLHKHPGWGETAVRVSELELRLMEYGGGTGFLHLTVLESLGHILLNGTESKVIFLFYKIIHHAFDVPDDIRGSYL